MMLLLLGMMLMLTVWVLMYGGNLLVRLWLERTLQAQPDTVLVLRIPHQPSHEKAWLPMIPSGVAAVSVFLVDDNMWMYGITIGLSVVLFLLWPLYMRSATRLTETLILNSKGLIMLPPRVGLLGQGTFKARIEWKDCLGYSTYRGSIMFALRPLGHVEQSYGTSRKEFEQALNQLGVTKLVAFNILARDEIGSDELVQLEHTVQTVADDVVAGSGTDMILAHAKLRAKVIYNHESDDGKVTRENALLHISMWEGETCAQEIEWLIWEIAGETVELIALPIDRLYESLDDRIQGMIEQRLEDMGKERTPTLLQ